MCGGVGTAFFSPSKKSDIPGIPQHLKTQSLCKPQSRTPQMTSDGKSLFCCPSSQHRSLNTSLQAGKQQRHWNISSLKPGVFPSTQDLITELNQKGKHFPLGKLLRMIKGSGLLSLSLVWRRQKDGNELN